MGTSVKNKSPNLLILKGHFIESVFIILFPGGCDFFQVIFVPNGLAEVLIPFVHGVAPVVVVKVYVALVSFHEVPDQIRIVHPGVGLDGVLTPEKEHGRVLCQDNGTVRDFLNELFCIGMVLSCAPRLLSNPSHEGQEIHKGKEHEENDKGGDSHSFSCRSRGYSPRSNAR